MRLKAGSPAATTANTLRRPVMLALILLPALVCYPQTTPPEIRKCVIHSTIDNQGYTDFVQTCRMYVVR